jgi:hypothetical protein
VTCVAGAAVAVGAVRCVEHAHASAPAQSALARDRLYKRRILNAITARV